METTNFETVKEWFESVKQRNRKQELSLSAKRSRISALNDYLYFNELCGEPLNPDELIEKALKDRKDAIRRLTNYFNWIQGKLEGVQPKEKKFERNAAITRQSYLRGFYTHNNIVFGKKEFPTPIRIVSAVTKIDEKTPMYDYDEEKDELEFKGNGLLQQLLANLSFRDQTIILSLFSTGADATDLFSLNVDFVRGQWNEKRLYWHGNRLKDLVAFKTFFSVEATEYVKRYVMQERKGAKDDEPLFVLGRDTFTYERKGKTVEVGGRMNAHMLAISLRRATEKMDFNEKTNPFRPKRFRHMFRTACGMAHVDPGFIHAFMGHVSDMSALYLEKERGLFLREYVRVEPFLTVAGVQKAGFSELVSEVQQLTNMISELKNELQEKAARIDELHKRIERFDDFRVKHEWFFKRLEEEYKTREDVSEPLPEDDIFKELKDKFKTVEEVKEK